MPTIDDLISYHNENEYLDFKQEEYKEPKKHELIKDVLALANAEHAGDKYIIIGVKKSGGTTELFDIENPSDSAHIQSYIQQYIKPDLKVDYYPHQYQGKNLMVLQLKAPSHQPYAMKKTLIYHGKKSYPADSMKIRKGSTTCEMSLEDLNRIYNAKHAHINPFEGKLSVTFENGQTSLVLSTTKDRFPPGVYATAKIIQRIDHLQSVLDKSPKAYMEQVGYRSSLTESLEGMTIDNLKDELMEVGQKYAEKDRYYFSEEISHKIQFYVQNASNQPLRNAVAEISITKVEGLHIAEKIMHNPSGPPQVASAEMLFYPSVKTMPGNIVKITSQARDVQHRLETELLQSRLRMWFNESLAGEKIILEITLHAENLPSPLSFQLEIRI